MSKRNPMPRTARRLPRAWARQALRVTGDYVLIAVGSVLVALAANLFFIPNRVVPGGVTGISTLLHYAIGTPVGLVTLALNVPLFIAGLIWAGGLSAGLRTVWSVVVMSAAIDLLQPYLPKVTQDPLLYALYGGILDGLGVGLVFLAGGTTGGTDIVARLLHRFFRFRLGHTLLAANVLILGSAALSFGIEPALYALLAAYVSTRVIDLVQQGMAQSRSAFIISEQPEVIKSALLSDLGRGVTVLQGEGGYTAQRQQVLLCAVAQSEVSRLKRLIHQLDPGAFVILTPADEVLGEGFAKLGR